MSALKAIVEFPAKEIEVMPFVNERSNVSARSRADKEMLAREKRAEAYSIEARRKANEDLMMFVSGLAMFAGLVALYFAGVIL